MIIHTVAVLLNEKVAKSSPPVAIDLSTYPYPFPDMTATVTPDEEFFTL